MQVNAKFKCETVTVREGSEEPELRAVYGESGPNAQWAKYTPSGSVKLFIDNPGAHGFFRPGKEYIVTFREVDVSKFSELIQGVLQDANLSEAGDQWPIIKLTVQCSACSGHGKVADFEADIIRPCTDCDGSGWVATYDGGNLITFLEQAGFVRTDSLRGWPTDKGAA